MVATANAWFKTHQEWKMLNCETIVLLFKLSDNSSYELRPNDSSFYIYGSGKNYLLKALRYVNCDDLVGVFLFLFIFFPARVWIQRVQTIPETSNESESSVLLKNDVTVLDYMDILPEYDKIHETLDPMIERINTNFLLNGLNGRILSIQSVPCEAELDWCINPERTLTELMSKTVTIIRIFYVIGDTTWPQIGMITIKLILTVNP